VFDWGNWENQCYTKTLDAFVDDDGDGFNDKGGLIVEARLYTYGTSMTLGVDNLSVTVDNGTVSFPPASSDPTCDDSAACNDGEVGDCEFVNVGWGNLQWPTGTTFDAGSNSENIYGQVWVEGVTGSADASSGVVAELDASAEPVTHSNTKLTINIF
jgi:hypothetical protein